MTDLDPEIWKNKTLGAEGAGPFLPELEKQQIEDVNARREGREPKVVEYVHRYPKFTESGSVPSEQQEFNFVEPETTYSWENTTPTDPDSEFE
ncbi:hypothetical protein [Streptomyces anandii]|uniref:hypothetical protein n=1 Tax=Streptomyces anandii TaxID=285454 RepID=UPI00368F1FEA